jgi:hypothetical protein
VRDSDHQQCEEHTASDKLYHPGYSRLWTIRPTLTGTPRRSVTVTTNRPIHHVRLDNHRVRLLVGRMKVLTTIILWAGCLSQLLGQTAPAKSPASASTNTAAGKQAAKVDLKEQLKGDVLTNSIGMVLVKISPTLWAGKFEVTQGEYQTVMRSNPSQFVGENNPVDSVSWNDARSFCAKLTAIEKKEQMLPEGCAYELPTQAQWESLAAGAGLETAVTSLSATRTATAPVGSLGANSLRLHDVRGNVWEWCLDPQDKPFRVLRGGAWDTSQEANLRPEFRWYSTGPDDRKNTFGFRCVLVPAAGDK